MKVKAAPGIKVPVEGRPHSYIEQSTVEVEDTLYYRRRLDDGDLIEVEQTIGRSKNKSQTNEEVTA